MRRAIVTMVSGVMLLTLSCDYLQSAQHRRQNAQRQKQLDESFLQSLDSREVAQNRVAELLKDDEYVWLEDNEKNLSAIPATVGSIYVFALNGATLAVQLTHTENATAKFNCWYTDDAQGKFPDIPEEVTVFENYERKVLGVRTASNGMSVASLSSRDLGSELYIEYPHISIEWSDPDYLYPPKGTKVLLTRISNIERVRQILDTAK